jgi:hypothetical protein
LEAKNDVNPGKDDCEILMNAVLPFAMQLLERYGEFFPFGAAMSPDGNIIRMGTYDGREQPPSSDVIRQLKQGFVAGARSNDCKATALVYDVLVSLPDNRKSDAIAIALDHRSAYSVIVLFPYSRDHQQLAIEPPVVQRGNAEIF